MYACAGTRSTTIATTTTTEKIIRINESTRKSHPFAAAMGHSSPHTQSILSSFHSNGSTAASAVSQMSSSPHTTKNRTDTSFSSYSTTAENKSAATFTVTPTRMGKRFTTIKMATASPKLFSRCDAAASGQQATQPHHVSNKQSRLFDPSHTSTPSQRAIQPFSTINATSMRRQATSKFAPKLLVPSSAPSALDRPIIVSSAATNVSEWSHSSAYLTPKCCAPFDWTSFNASNCGRRAARARIVKDNYCRTTPSQKMMRTDLDVHLSTPRRPMQPSRARISLLSKFQKYANIL